MNWHAEVTLQLRVQIGGGAWLDFRRYTLRAYAEPGGYEARRPFDAVAQADLLGDKAFLHAMLRRDGLELSREAYRSLATLLAQFGVRQVTASRHGVDVTLEVDRWAKAPAPTQVRRPCAPGN